MAQAPLHPPSTPLFPLSVALTASYDKREVRIVSVDSYTD